MGRRGNRESEQNRGLEKFGIQKKNCEFRKGNYKPYIFIGIQLSLYKLVK